MRKKIVIISAKALSCKLFYIVFLFFLFIQSPQANAKTIKMAWFVVLPHTSVSEDGITPSGPSITLFNKIALKMGYDVEWIGPVSLTRLGDSQKTGRMELDGTILHIKTPAVMPYLYYPDKPYFIAYPSLAVRIDNPIKKIASIEDIKGYRIGFVRTFSSSYTYPAIIQNNRDKVIIDDITGDDWTRRNIGKLISNRIDAVYERNQYTLNVQATLDNVIHKIKILPLPGEPIFHYFVFHKKSPIGVELLNRYNHVAAGMDIDYDAMVYEEITRLKAKYASR